MLAAAFVTDVERYKDCLGLWERLLGAVDLEEGSFATSTFGDAIFSNATFSDE